MNYLPTNRLGALETYLDDGSFVSLDVRSLIDRTSDRAVQSHGVSDHLSTWQGSASM